MLKYVLLLLPLTLFAAPQVYTRPGIVTLQGGSWEGSDHLLNLKGPVNVVVEILKPQNVEVPLSADEIESRITTEFKKVDLTSGNYAVETPGIPFFNILIVAYPVEKGYVASVDARLIEVIEPFRVRIDPSTFFQAVTWEKKSLLVAPTEEFSKTVDKTIDDLVKTFIERVSYFKEMNRRHENKDGVERLTH